MKNRTEEKERLWKEVFGKKRPYEESEHIQKTLKDNQEALDQLNTILHKQNQEIYQQNQMELEQLEKDIQQDYGRNAFREVQKTTNEIDFIEIKEELNEKVPGQKEALTKLVQAIRRPFLQKQDGIQNIIVLAGPKGVGKRESLVTLLDILKEKSVFLSNRYSELDLSRYQDGSNEQVFLQDLYQANEERGSFLVVEKVEEADSYYIRRMEEYITNGSIQLNKRYVLKEGVLVENQSGLVKESVDHLNATKKYLVFITDLSLKKFLELWKPEVQAKMVDCIEYQSLSSEVLKQVLEQYVQEIQEQAQINLGLSLTFSEESKEYMLAHYKQKEGKTGLKQWISIFRKKLEDMALQQELKEKKATIEVKEKQLVVKMDELETVVYEPVNEQEALEQIEKSFETIIGLEEVKEKIRSYQALFLAQKRREEQGLPVKPISMHMLFMGNPGTGKTMIARLLAQYLKNIGLLQEGQLVEVTRSDLVAKYVGQTAPLTKSVIQKAKGGVLFIDEAYSLYRGEQDSFGLEAIDTIVKSMEDSRGDLVVILAGYEKEMEEFLTANTGLASRFPNQFHFQDYQPEELEKIAVLEAKKQGYHWDKKVQKELVKYFMSVDTSGNGRFARNLVEKAIVNQATRLLKEKDAVVDELVLADFSLK
ncbi:MULTISPECIES: AAA family ATPase [Terrabacteria group]|uniref:AAA family ATPase n=1 Tax=Bacillati TaxID=1783272 RepID=UPI001C6F2250|nr:MULTISPECIES: AAA family ATPase [Terrabacteria group]MBW9212552.1 AAA family ATPase [Trueperella sp. zg.1013]